MEAAEPAHRGQRNGLCKGFYQPVPAGAQCPDAGTLAPHEEEYRLCSALKRAVWGDTINEPDNGLAFEFRGFTVSFAEGKIFVSDEGRTFVRYEISHFLQDPGAVVRGIRRECLRRDSMRELSKI